MLGPGAAPFDLRFIGPDGTEHTSAHLILVSNDRYQLGSGNGFGSCRSIDGGNLGIGAGTFRSSADAGLRRTGGDRIDGEALVLDPPIRFRTLPGALRVRIPVTAPGYSPAAAAPTPGWAGVTALLQTAAGHPVASVAERPCLCRTEFRVWRRSRRPRSRPSRRCGPGPRGCSSTGSCAR